MIKILPAAEGSGEFLLYDGETLCGKGTAEYGDALRILSVEAPDDLLKEGMIRALLNAGRMREIPTAVCGNEALFPLLRRLEFVPCDEGMRVDIAEFFFKGCKK